MIQDQYIEFRQVITRQGWHEGRPSEEIHMRVRGDQTLEDVISTMEQFLRAIFPIELGQHLELIRDDHDRTKPEVSA